MLICKIGLLETLPGVAASIEALKRRIGSVDSCLPSGSCLFDLGWIACYQGAKVGICDPLKRLEQFA